jgi:hypothetical protein
MESGKEEQAGEKIPSVPPQPLSPCLQPEHESYTAEAVTASTD